MSYRHTQVGWPVVALFTAMFVAVVGGVYDAVGFSEPAAFLVGALVLLPLLLFGALTVEVRDTHLLVRLGIGVIRTSVALSDIRDIRAVRNSWLFGWGIRIIPGGWLYNVWGLDAVEVVTAGGKVLRVGTDEPAALVAALRERIGPRTLSPAETRQFQQRVRAGLAIAVTLVMALVAWPQFAFTRVEPPSAVRVMPQFLLVDGTPRRMDLDRRRIIGVTLEERLAPSLHRVGWPGARRGRGQFEADGIGRGMLFVDRERPPFVLVRTPDAFVYLGYHQSAETIQLHRKLLAELPVGRVAHATGAVIPR